MPKIVFEDDVKSLSQILPGAQRWGGLETVGDVYMYWAGLTERMDIHANMYRMHIEGLEFRLPEASKTYVSALRDAVQRNYEYENRTIIDFLVSRGLQKMADITPASNTGVEVNPHA